MSQSSFASFVLQAAFSRQLIKYPWQLSLALLGVSAGIAVIVAIQLVRVSAYESFEQATLINSGHATHHISPRQGNTLEFKFYANLKKRHPHIAMSPTLQFDAKVLAGDAPLNSDLTILGIEPISQINRQNRKADTTQGRPPDLNIESFISDPNFVAINQWTSEALQVSLNDLVKITRGELMSELKIGAILPNQDITGGITNNTLLLDISVAQRLLNNYSVISRIDLDLDEASAARLNASLPSKVVLTDIKKQTARLRRMTQAFYTNLTALSLMALMMGVFLIYNTEAFLVLQRQQMIARLKALGVTNRSIFRAMLTESALLGFIGSLLGVILGYFLATSLLKYVSTTLNDLYFKSDTSDIIVDPLLTCGVIAVGVLVTVCAGYPPARFAATSPLVQTLNRISNNQRKPSDYYRRPFYFALTTFAIAIASLALIEHINGGFFAIACVLLGFAALCIPCLHWLTNRDKARFFASTNGPFSLQPSLFARVGVRTVGLSLGRSGTAAAALMIATAAGIGIGVMVASFRESVSDWLASSLRAEFYVSKSFSLDDTTDEHISSEVISALKNLAAVDSISTVLRAKAAMLAPSREHEIRLSAFQLNDAAKSGFEFLASEHDVWDRWNDGNTILITEPFAYHYRLNVGDEVTLHTDRGRINFAVIGIYKDYASEQGGVSLNREIFDQHWRIDGYSGLGVYSTNGLSLDELQEHMRNHEILAGLSVVSSADLLQQSLDVFDRTFLVTNLLKVITIAVAFVGIVGALLAQQLERSREYGMYRALGLSRGEILRIILAQTLSIGLVAALLALPAGLSVAWILIEIINPRSFGWTMNAVIPVTDIAVSFFIAIAAASIAGVFPALRITKLPPAKALRYE